MRSHMSALARTAAGVTVTAAALLAATAPAAAEPDDTGTFRGPDLTAVAEGNVVDVTVTNPNLGDVASTCGAVAVDAAQLPAVLDDPAQLLQPGVVVWTSGLNAVTAGTTRSYTTPELAEGVYAFVGACVSLSHPAPELSEPVMVGVGSTFGSVDMMNGSLGDIDFDGLLGLLG